MQRLFGEQIGASGRRCLYPDAARQPVDEKYNKAMTGGGHCFRFSVLEPALFLEQRRLSNPRCADSCRSEIVGASQALQREIAYSWHFQALEPVREQVIKGKPSEYG